MYLTSFQNAIEGYVKESAAQGVAVHQVEKGLWERLLQLGYYSESMYFALTGQGDLGETVTLPSGRVVRQSLKNTHLGGCRSIFGSFELERTVYGAREGQKIEFVPADNRLQLPRSKFSDILQDWAQSLAVETSYNQVNEILAKILGIKLSTDSLERTTRCMGSDIPSFWSTEKNLEPSLEEQLIVASADGKGVPICHQSDARPILDHKPARGPKPDRKKMAIVGTVYSMAPVIRTPEEVVASLFKNPQPKSKSVLKKSRPQPKNKQVRASLTLEKDGDHIKGSTVIFDWMARQVKERNPDGKKQLVVIMDGQKSLWNHAESIVMDFDSVQVLDILHVTPKIWSAAYLFCQWNSEDAIEFVKDYILRVLKGQTSKVIESWQNMAESRGLKGEKLKNLQQIIGYLKKNQHRMRYDLYLAAGYPIASGVIEGACRRV